MPSGDHEFERAQARIREVIGPELAKGEDAKGTLSALLEVLVRELRLDFACVRLSDAARGAPLDLLRLPEHRAAQRPRGEWQHAFKRCLEAEGPRWPFVVPNPLGPGHVSIAVLPFAHGEHVGRLVASSGRADFPTRIERRILEYAAGKATRVEAPPDEERVQTAPMAGLEAVEPTTLQQDPPLDTGQAKTAACVPLQGGEREPADVYEANAAIEQIVRGADGPSESIARLQAYFGRPCAPVRAVQMQDVIAEVMATARGAAHAHAVSVRVESASTPLPPVLGNAIELQQVVLNLVMNAIESMADVPVRRRVLVVRTQKHGRDALLVRIRDSGKGLEPQHRRRAFEGFFTTKADGLGIGLAVSRMIIEARGGRLWASANEDTGETFQFTLPVASSVADTTARLDDGTAESDYASSETARVDS